MTNNINIINFDELISPNELIKDIALSNKNKDFIIKSRNEIANIIHRKTNKLLVIIGPCSIHNVDEAKVYANKLKILQEKFKDKLYIVMRVYFEKPRTSIGWKGLINDPFLNGSFEINYGLRLARELLLYINNIEIPCAVEFLDNIIPQYIADLVSWGAIGARTTESQIHREMASGLSMPIGFKNSTDGNVEICIDAIKCASAYHHFMAINDEGKAAIAHTKGNKNAHIILRGGKLTGPNYKEEHINKVVSLINNNNINTGIIIDCSHGNSQKNYKNQVNVCNYIGTYLLNKNIICGIMIESNINDGAQKIASELKYGVSITDACINLETSEEILKELYDKIDKVI